MDKRRTAVKLERLYDSAETDLANVIASPIWRQLRRQDQDFLTRTPPTFLLQLLREHVLKHRRNPWSRLPKDRYSGEVRWPQWKAPILTLVQSLHKHPADPEVIGNIARVRRWLA